MQPMSTVAWHPDEGSEWSDTEDGIGKKASHASSSIGQSVRDMVAQKSMKNKRAHFFSCACFNQCSRDLPWIPSTTHGDWRVRAFLLFEEASLSHLGRLCAIFEIVAIALNIVCLVLESMPEMRQRPAQCAELLAAGLPLTVVACQPQPIEIFEVLEAFFVMLFTFDYLARILTVHAVPGLSVSSNGLLRTLQYARRPLCIIDFIAIMPWYANLLLGSQGAEAIEAVSALRLLRTLRLLKLVKYYPGLALFVDVVRQSGEPLAILLFFNTIIIVLFGSLIFFAEGRRFSVAPEFTEPAGANASAPYPTGVYVRLDQAMLADEVSPFRSIPYAMWWVCTTMTTVGYGDISPTTVGGKIVAVASFYVGVIFLALPISILGANFEELYEQRLRGEDPRSRTPGRLAPLAAKSIYYGSEAILEVRTATDDLDEEEGNDREQHLSVSRRVFVLLEGSNGGLLSRLYSLLMMLIILLSTGAFIMESIPDFNHTPAACTPGRLTVEDCEPKPEPWFWTLEVVCICIFTVDYGLRVTTVHAALPEECGVNVAEEVSPLRLTQLYCGQTLNLLDLFAILPFYVESAFPGVTGGGLAVLRVTRLVRIFRVLKMPKLRSCVRMFINVLQDAMPALFICLFMTSITALFFASAVVWCEGTSYSVEHFREDHPFGAYVRPTKDGYDMEVSPFRCIAYALWWFFVTATTVGYGDDFPTTTLGRCVGVLAFYFGLVLLALPITAVGNSFNTYYPAWLDEVNSLKSRGSVGTRRSISKESCRREEPVEALASEPEELPSRKAWS